VWVLATTDIVSLLMGEKDDNTASGNYSWYCLLNVVKPKIEVSSAGIITPASHVKIAATLFCTALLLAGTR